jgi:hypothetical protein
MNTITKIYNKSINYSYSLYSLSYSLLLEKEGVVR